MLLKLGLHSISEESEIQARLYFSLDRDRWNVQNVLYWFNAVTKTLTLLLLEFV